MISRSMWEKDHVIALVFVLPTMVWIFSIVGYPIVLVFSTSLRSASTIARGTPFVGLAHYVRHVGSLEFGNTHFARCTGRLPTC